MFIVLFIYSKNIKYIQNIVTSAQSFGSQDYHNEYLMTILELAGLLFCENEMT